MPGRRLIPVSNLRRSQGEKGRWHGNRRVAVIVAILGSVLVTSLAQPQETHVTITPRKNTLRRRIPGQSNIRLDVNLVLVPVTVTDLWNQPVTDLKASSFRVFEDNIEQQIVSVFREDGPVSVGLLLDASSSMKKRIDRSVEAIRDFFQSSIPGDEFFLVRFNDRPSLATGFTPNPSDIIRDLPSKEPQGWTALLDAIGLGVHEMKKAKNSRRALLVLTDGGDNNSRFSESEIKNLVMESDIRLYAIGITEQYKFLEKLAAESGGRSYFARKLDDLPDAMSRLSRDLRDEYLIGYSSNNRQNDGKYRALKVEVVRPPAEKQLNVAWRRGYYAPPD